MKQFPNLIQNKFSSESYFCTWSAQSGFRTAQERKADIPSMRDNLTEETVFGENGMINAYPEIRSKLRFLFDDGWDVDFNLTAQDVNAGMFGSQLVNEKRFPSCTGNALQRLQQLDRMVKSYGWKGTGLWICANGYGETNTRHFSQEETEHYWRERLRNTNKAGIGYWKVDWGHFGGNPEFFKKLQCWAKEEAPALIIESAPICMPLNGLNPNSLEADASGRFMDWNNEPFRWTELLQDAQIFRLYDVTVPLSIPTMLDRIVSMLKMAKIKGDCNGYLNCEDEVYIGAVLACQLGIMRSPFTKIDHEPDGSTVNRITEAVRAVNWQTSFAPPIKISEANIQSSLSILTDEYNFKDDSWLCCYGDRTVGQSAPAILSLCCELPFVNYKEKQKPYVVASKHPNGCSAVAVLPRSENGKYYTPAADVTIHHDFSKGALGVFGRLSSLTITTDNDLLPDTFLAQDLAGKNAVDIKDAITKTASGFTISGELLSKIGTSANKPKDFSAPGLVLSIK